MSKPILSELEYNADDVASAILDKADLSVTNQDFAVTTVSSLFTASSGTTISTNLGYSFNGFMFISCRGYTDSTPSEGATIMTIDAGYTPIANTDFPTISYQGDLANFIRFNTDDDVTVHSAAEGAGSTWYFCINGSYRHT